MTLGFSYLLIPITEPGHRSRVHPYEMGDTSIFALGQAMNLLQRRTFQELRLNTVNKSAQTYSMAFSSEKCDFDKI